MTSVNIIYLLEQLFDTRFTVEVKEWIRTDLEDFQHISLIKDEPDTLGFFKLVMIFPAPKPRNIEKDFKVFYWKDLARILKKICGSFVRILISLLIHRKLITSSQRSERKCEERERQSHD